MIFPSNYQIFLFLPSLNKWIHPHVLFLQIWEQSQQNATNVTFQNQKWMDTLVVNCIKSYQIDWMIILKQFLVKYENGTL